MHACWLPDPATDAHSACDSLGSCGRWTRAGCAHVCACNMLNFSVITCISAFMINGHADHDIGKHSGQVESLCGVR